MTPITQIMYDDMMGEISQIANERDTLIRTHRTVSIVLGILLQLKERIKQLGFKDEAEEIAFFKHEMPQFNAMYIFHASIYYVEIDKPLGSRKATVKYFRDELRKIDNFFYHQLDFYKYYRSGNTHLDREYFIRGQDFNGFSIDIATPIIDRETCTIHSLKISFIIAYQQLREYFQNAMAEIDAPPKVGPALAANRDMTWTDSKTGLVELAYALHATGSFNNGKADLKQVTEHLEKVFNVQLGNTSRTFQEILERKKGYTSFLDRLKKALVKRMTDND